MTTSKYIKYEPQFAICPGETVRESIEALGLTQKEFAARLGISEKHLITLINGECALTNEMALKLEHATGTPARIWNSFESGYREQLTKIKMAQEIQEHSDWLKAMPFKVIADHLKIQIKDISEKYFSLLRFFGVANYEAWEKSRPVIAYRKGATFKDSSLKQQCAIQTWLRLIELQAMKIDVPEYNKSQFKNAVEQIRTLTTLQPEEFIPQMESLCNQAGVIFILEKEIPGASVNGALRWIRQNKTPVICLNLRGKYNDIFWFTFFHEAGHLLVGKKELFIDTPEQYASEEEDKANLFATNILFPQQTLKELESLETEEQVKEFSDRINLHPGCVAGQMAYRKLIPYNSPLLQLREKYQWGAGEDSVPEVENLN
ncbi:MAG: helix-turn-helix domain-containing protein [Thermoguttaceae bacterium]|nr:helix-turn-helix domain-containing protein [Thermoguttaceae bacterium]